MPYAYRITVNCQIVPLKCQRLRPFLIERRKIEQVHVVFSIANHIENVCKKKIIVQSINEHDGDHGCCTLTVVKWKFRFNVLLEHCHNIVDDVYLLRADIFMILRPVSRRNANDSLVPNKTSKFGAGMNVMPFLEHQIMIVRNHCGMTAAFDCVTVDINIVRFEYRQVVTH